MAYEDEEQLEQIRDWWRRNGRSVLIGVGAALVMVIGWQQWGAWESRQHASAATQYASVLANLNDGNVAVAAEQFQALSAAHSRSPYSVFAGLTVSAQQVEQGEPAAAAETLGQVNPQAAEGVFAELVRLRQAEALVAAGQNELALSVLEPVPAGELTGRYLELKGDLLFAAGQREAAIQAYQEALGQPLGQRRTLVELKLGDLGARPSS